MNHQNFTENGNQKFPLSTQALAFMQEQIKLAYGFADLAGANIIVREPTASKEGLVIFDGDLLPMAKVLRPTGAATRFAYITIAEQTETMSVEGKFEGNVRTTRIASYTVDNRLRPSSQTRKALSAFTTLKPIATIMAELDEAKKHVMPKGSIIAWSGTCDCDHIPYGFIPCGGFFGGSASQFAPSGTGTIEVAKWQAKYDNISINSYAINQGSLVGIKVSSCNGVTIPDLTDRFIVQAGMSYSAGDTGGVNDVTLTAEQSGMPAHHHTLYIYSHISNPGVTSEKRWVPDTVEKTFGGYNTLELEKRNASQSHENRPPFYALCYLIKVI